MVGFILLLNKGKDPDKKGSVTYKVRKSKCQLTFYINQTKHDILTRQIVLIGDLPKTKSMSQVIFLCNNLAFEKES